MGFQNREIEKKFIINCSISEAIIALFQLFPSQKETTGVSADYYWHSKSKNADFIRLRFMPEGDGQLTIKHKDQRSNFNRVEIDVPTSEPDQALLFLTRLHGEPVKRIVKHYYSIHTDEHTSISLYFIEGYSQLYLEVEADTEEKVEEIAKLLSVSIEMKFEPRSLYEILVKGSKNARKRRPSNSK
jgi:hypothetical protein